MVSGIYKIINTKNKHFYIGSSTNIDKRWKFHVWKLNTQQHENSHLQRAWNKYGADAFILKIIEICPRDILLEIEQPYLNKHVGKSNCYNIATSASAPMQDRHHSSNTKKKIGASNAIKNKGKILSDATKQKLSQNNAKYWLGKKRSKKTKEKLSISCGGINNPKAKLTENDVRIIRTRPMSLRKMAKFYKVGKDTILNIVKYRSYKHVI